jgi:hypothetical protein
MTPGGGANWNVTCVSIRMGVTRRAGAMALLAGPATVGQTFARVSVGTALQDWPRDPALQQQPTSRRETFP